MYGRREFGAPKFGRSKNLLRKYFGRLQAILSTDANFFEQNITYLSIAQTRRAVLTGKWRETCDFLSQGD